MKLPGECENIAEIRQCIDNIDRNIIQLLAHRSSYVKKAAKYKKSVSDVKAPDRVKSMLESRRQWANEFGINAGFIQAIFEDVVTFFIKGETTDWVKGNTQERTFIDSEEDNKDTQSILTLQKKQMTQFGGDHYNESQYIRPGSYAVILNDRNQMGIIEQNGCYFLPGGGIEIGESETQAVLRETREETGLEIAIERHLCYANEWIQCKKPAKYFNQTGTFFKCSIIRDHQDQSDLTHTFKWVDIDFGIEHLSYSNHKWATIIGSENIDVFKYNSNGKKAIGTFRLIKYTELSKLLNLYKHLHQYDSQPENVYSFKQIWESICTNPDILYFVAEADGQLVGSCHMVIVPNLTRGCKPYGVIENVVTHADYRSNGIGKGILRYALSVAWAFDCYKVILMTGSKIELVHTFYEHAGFQKNLKTAFIAQPHKREF